MENRLWQCEIRRNSTTSPGELKKTNYWYAQILTEPNIESDWTNSFEIMKSP